VPIFAYPFPAVSHGGSGKNYVVTAGIARYASCNLHGSEDRIMNNTRTTRRGAFALVALLPLAVLTVAAEEPRVYTNADLANLPKLDLPSVSAPAAAVEAAPLSLAYEAPRLESLAPLREDALLLAERNVLSARDRLNELEAKRAIVEDPFLGRPTMSADELALWVHLDNVERRQLVEDQIADAKADVVAAEALLSRN